jgi:hypothetical protein
MTLEGGPVSTQHPNLQPAPPFQPSNDLAITHGAYARLRLSKAAGETADVVRDLVPLKHEADEPTIQSYAVVLEQLRAAAHALESADGRRDRMLRLSQDAQGWANVALRYGRELGLDLARVFRANERELDLARLTDKQRAELDALLSIAEGSDDERP